MTMPPTNPDWERRLHEELRKLPELEAPATLVPNVLAAIRARESGDGARAWYRQPATSWPVALRFALAIAALVLFAVIAFGASSIDPSAAPTSTLGMFAQKLLGLLSGARALVEALVLVVREALSPLVAAIIGAMIFSYLALLGIGSALWRAALHPRGAALLPPAGRSS